MCAYIDMYTRLHKSIFTYYITMYIYIYVFASLQFLVANLVTTSKALVPRSDALVTTSFLLLLVRHLFLVAMHLLLVAICMYSRMLHTAWRFPSRLGKYHTKTRCTTLSAFQFPEVTHGV